MEGGVGGLVSREGNRPFIGKPRLSISFEAMPRHLSPPQRGQEIHSARWSHGGATASGEGLGLHHLLESGNLKMAICKRPMLPSRLLFLLAWQKNGNKS